MASFIFNVAKGRTAHYAGLPNANDALVLIPIEASGVEADAVLVDYDTVAVLLAAANNEQSTMGRKTLSGVTVTVNDTDNRVDLDCDDVTWSGATGNAISDVLLAYDPDTTGGTDADLIPIAWYDFAITPDGSDVVVSIADFARSA